MQLVFTIFRPLFHLWVIYSHNVGEGVGLLYSCRKTFSLVVTERKTSSHLILLTALTRICFAISAGLLKDSEKESTCCLRRPALHLYDWRSYRSLFLGNGSVYKLIGNLSHTTASDSQTLGAPLNIAPVTGGEDFSRGTPVYNPMLFCCLHLQTTAHVVDFNLWPWLQHRGLWKHPILANYMGFHNTFNSFQGMEWYIGTWIWQIFYMVLP
jgi:hypothetical protein